MGVVTKTNPIRLLYSEKGSDVLVLPEDQDAFMMRVEEAIIACRIFDDYKSLFPKQLDHLADVLGEWISQHNNKIHKGLLTLTDSRMLFLVVLKNKTYDSTLEQELTELDLQVARDSECSQISLDVQALPLCDEVCYISFCNPEWILEYSMSNA